MTVKHDNSSTKWGGGEERLSSILAKRALIRGPGVGGANSRIYGIAHNNSGYFHEGLSILFVYFYSPWLRFKIVQ